MRPDVSIEVDHVSKKYARALKQSMLYGLEDLSRNLLGIRSRHETLRKHEFWAVDDVSLEIKRGESVALIGPNGSGKTTLLKMINGIFWPDRGSISVRGRVGALIAVGAGFHPLLTGRENIFINGAILGMSRAELAARFDAIVDFAQIGDFLDTPVKHYSSGMFVRLGFAVAAHSEPDVLLVDEVLAVGDRGFQTKCFKKMGELRQRGTTFVVVSHNMHTVAGFVDWVALLKNGKMKRYDDPFEGIGAYSKLFLEDDGGIERLVSAGKFVEFSNVELTQRELMPGEAFSIVLPYDCKRAYDDIEVDIAIYDLRDPDLHYQGTNHAYDRRIDLKEGKGTLAIEIQNLQINGSLGRITVAVWSKNRTEQLFWWRVPVTFRGMPHSTGKNFVPIRFDVSSTT
ncbi:MAG: ABC transporter ATP-binding protein [Polyangiaceae bacterium]|nr:ABC transporter ATP-binding protein [Polyangiaceae bacterium]NUQ75942.1 ABC transporter ATP-binding protein [Polyangiaceae bacterium]